MDIHVTIRIPDLSDPDTLATWVRAIAAAVQEQTASNGPSASKDGGPSPRVPFPSRPAKTERRSPPAPTQPAEQPNGTRTPKPSPPSPTSATVTSPKSSPIDSSGSANAKPSKPASSNLPPSTMGPAGTRPRTERIGPIPEDPPEWVSTKTAAAMYGCSPATIRKLDDAGKVATTKSTGAIGRPTKLYKIADLDQHLTRKTQA